MTAALSQGQAYATLRELCETAPHRLSGSEGAATAVAWAKAKMEAFGLQNVRLEACEVPRWERGQLAELVVLEDDALSGASLPILALGGSEPTPADGIEGEVMVVHDFEELAERKDEAAGRIVLFNRPMQDSLLDPFGAYGGAVNQRTQGASEAAKYGAVAAITRSMTTRRDDVPHTGAMRYTDGVTRIPSAAISTNGADLIEGWLAAGNAVRLRLKLDCRWLEPVESYNVVGELPGREFPEQIVVVGGHLDGWDVGQGAHDDGAGSVHALEAVRLLKSLGLEPRRTVRCVLFMNEENGLAGGRAYFTAHEDELDRHVLAIESDRGGFTPRGFTAQVNDEALEELQALMPLLELSGATQLKRGGGGADISPMGARGVPLIGLYPDPQRYFDFHHSEKDVLEAVNPRELQLGASALASLIWLVTERELPLPRIEMPAAGR